jgi:signal transduction histidine kinase
MQKMYTAWKEQKKFITIDLQGTELEEYFQFLKNSGAPVRREIFGDRRIENVATFSKGVLMIITPEPRPAETIQVLERFAGVFDLTYTRFLDLQKAEAQAREAKIEAALERVRSRTMAMHKSDELNETNTTIIQQIKSLEIRLYAFGIHICHANEPISEAWMGDPVGGYMPKVIYDHSQDPLSMKMYSGWKEGKTLIVEKLEGEALKEHFEYMITLVPDRSIFDNLVAPESLVFHFAYFTYGFFVFLTQEHCPEEHSFFKRLAKVFEQTYTRFLDLQKAEAQAREAKIEASLERVRAKAMSMHKSEDLNPAVATVFEELDKLNLGVLRCGIGILDKEKRSADVWTTAISDHGTAIQVSGDESMDIHPLLQEAFDAWLKQKDFSYLLEGDDLTQYYKAVSATNFQLPESQIISSETDPIAIGFRQQYYHIATFQAGGLFAFRETAFPEEAKTVMKRFANVFNLTYKRFLDLQKAEAQTRQAQIETAMEKVRARALAMQKPEELVEVAQVLRKEMGLLGVEELETSSIYIHDEVSGTTECWYAIQDIRGQDKKLVTDHMIIHLNDTWVGREMQKFYTSGQNQTSILMQGENRKEWINYCSQHSKLLQGYYGDTIPERTYHLLKFSNGYMGAASPGDISSESWELLQRATSVFSLAYTRFSDLQQAEANAREAQIEAGLERVRARTMAMHSSEDVSTATATMFTELEKLGIENYRGGITNIRADQTQEVWSVNNLAEGKTVKAVGTFDMNMHPIWQRLFQGWEKKEEFQYGYLTGKEKEDYIKILNTTPDYLSKPIQNFPDMHFQSYYFGEGAVWSYSLQPHLEEDKQVMKRFTSVFSLTFRRYQDLKKAEAQAREATIEAALERVRGKAMAMHNSNDLSSAASMVFSELRKLGIHSIRCGVGLLNKESRKAQLYSATSSADGDSLALVGWVMLSGHSVLENIYDTWLKNEDYYPELSGEQLKSYYENLLSGLSLPSVPDWQIGQKQYGTFLPFSVGCLYAWSETSYNDAEIKILKRFATIIDLTFRRYIELQKSEANAREAVKQAALDRIRADIASMRTIADLERITPLIWNELTILGVPFIRCGVFIMDEEQKLIHTFLSTPDGKAIGAFHIPYDTPGNIAQVLSHWHDKKNYIDRWDESAFTEFAGTLVKQGVLSSPEQYLKTLPRGGFYLHFLPFLQGMLYVGNSTRLGEEDIKLIQSVADAFSTAYARYEDFNKLEAAKQQVEKTLVDLKQTQTQLIQSEKMASLGELTAGIAHEIQNPLNFVNNFSEVSTELLDEMITELGNNNKEDAIAIADDVKQNLEKILHHGKRADGIVKGMLQHSRSSSATKEPTDINKLADEYLRLAYHGLRAKDKSFNATMKTEYDETIGNINIIPQDIGRAILNLITNAFYAVTEKKKQFDDGYEPTVSVSTKKLNGKVEVSVKDNGNGIPQKVLDKIFQPFFTTKPTGQGTGLGLSLSYDIVKAHGGELKVETKEGEGAEFIVNLPHPSRQNV